MLIRFMTWLAQIPIDAGGDSNSDSTVVIPRVEATNSNLVSAANFAVAIAGGLSVLFIVIGGFKYVISTGNPDKIRSAKDTIIYAVIGLIVSIGAFTVVNYVLTNV